MREKFEKLRGHGKSQHHADLLAIFERVVFATHQQATGAITTTPNAPSPETNVQDASRAAAAKIDEKCPKLDSANDVEGFLFGLWERLICVACIVPYDHVGQDHLVAMLESLRSWGKGTVNIWGVSKVPCTCHKTLDLGF